MQRGTSNAPLILGIIGAVLMLPGLMCSVCVGGVAAAGGMRGATVIGLVFGAAPIILGIVGGTKGKSNPNMSMVLLLVSALCAFIGWYFTAFTSLFHLAALILFLIGAIMAKVQKME